MSEIIGVDVDDTLYSFAQAAREELADWTGPDRERFRSAAYAQWTDWRSADELCDGRFFDVIKKVHSDAVIKRQKPFPGSKKVLKELDEAGHRMRYITSRDGKCKTATADWLFDVCGFPEGELICSYDDKIPRISDCRYIIDDRPKTLVQFVYDFQYKYKHGSEHKKRMGFGIHATQNMSLTDVPGIYLAPTWGLLRRYLVEKGELIDD